LNSDDAISDATHDSMHDATAGDPSDEIELVVVTMAFDSADDASLLAVLSKYVVITRMEEGCRNVDLVSSVTHPGRHLVIEKWESPEHQRHHFDAPSMVEMARSCNGLLTGPPDLDLWNATSAHDLRGPGGALHAGKHPVRIA
jgi:quinol monooxygenase YgiN